MKIRQLLTLASLAALISLSEALYFHIAETERKCFIEEIPEETMVQGEISSRIKYVFLNVEYVVGSRSALFFQHLSLNSRPTKLKEILLN